MYDSQTPPWVLSAMQGLVGNQQQQPQQAQGMQTQPAMAQAFENPITDTQNNTNQQNLANQGGMTQGQQGQMAQAPLMQPQQAVANDPLMSDESDLNPDAKGAKRWGQFWGGMGGGMGGGGMGMMMI